MSFSFTVTQYQTVWRSILIPVPGDNVVPSLVVKGYHEQYSSMEDVEFRHNTQKIKRGC